ncbi:MAG TPA: SdrD B-like domain-containing protein [Caulifigura sp.]|nr:SdrD B-like domain-containing protein [Caulifigura sp.]
MTVSLVRIRQILRRTLGGVRRRPVGASYRAETLEQRQLLSAKRGYDSIQAEQAATHPTDSHDHRLHVDGLPLSAGTTSGTGTLAGAAPYNLAQTFQLNSLPGATKTIYLDFNGNTTSGTWWNSSYTSGAAFTTPAFSTDSSAAFSDAELERIQLIWQRVAEDYAPFNVNVTTQDPGTAGIVKSGTGDTAWGVRVVIGGDYQDWFGDSAGGVAYLNTFGTSVDQNVFVFSNSLGNGEKNVAEAISHEAGHSLGLSHDGTSSVGYYQGHGTGATGWAPIMGVGYYRELTQWSKGEYTGANNKQDDLAIITSSTNGFGYRVDDYASTRTSAAALASTTTGGVKTVDVAGIIERNSDQDWFSFTTSGGAVSLTFDGAARGTNLDIAASLYNASGQLILDSNPADLTTASISTTLAAGTYFVMVDGVGARGLSDGYSDYGSLGQYFITGTIPDDGTSTPPPPSSGLASISGRVWHDADADGSVDVGDNGLANVRVYVDANNNGAFDSTEQSVLTSADGTYTLAGLTAGTYRLRELPPVGFKQVYPSANGSRSVSVSTGQTVSRIDFRALQTPEIANLGPTTNYLARQAATPVAPTGTMTDSDTSVFTNFRLTAQLTSGGNRYDRLAIRNQGLSAGLVGVSGRYVYYSGVRIGTWSGGSGTGKLTITFNASATSSGVQAVLRNITYRSTSSTPLAGAKTVQFVMTESNGAAGSAATKQILI